MAIFNSYLKLPEGTPSCHFHPFSHMTKMMLDTFFGTFFPESLWHFLLAWDLPLPWDQLQISPRTCDMSVTEMRGFNSQGGGETGAGFAMGF